LSLLLFFVTLFTPDELQYPPRSPSPRLWAPRGRSTPYSRSWRATVRSRAPHALTQRPLADSNRGAAWTILCSCDTQTPLPVSYSRTSCS